MHFPVIAATHSETMIQILMDTDCPKGQFLFPLTVECHPNKGAQIEGCFKTLLKGIFESTREKTTSWLNCQY